MILDCVILDGNPADSTLAETMIDRQVELYERAPRQVAYDGAFSSKANLEAIKGRNDLFLCRHTLFVDHSALGLVDDFLGEDEKVRKIRGDPLRTRSLHRLGQARLFQLFCNALSGAIGFFRHLQ